MPRDLVEFPEIGVQPQVPALLPIGHRRLLRLAEFLETVPPEQFDMSSWISECGTAACAAGWAARIPEFNAAGYRCDAWSGPRFGGESLFGALRLFFGLSSSEQSEYIFGYKHYLRTPRDEAYIIREFVAARRST